MLTLVTLTFFTLFLFVKPRLAFLFYVLCYPIIPKYLNIEVTSSVYVSHQTVMFLILFFYVFLLSLGGQLRNKRFEIINHHQIFVLLVLFLGVKFLATFLLSSDVGGGVVSNLYYAFDSIGIILLASIFIRSRSEVKQLVYTVVISSLIVLGMALVEKSNGANIFAGITDIRYDFYLKVLEGSIRNDEYRLMAAFHGNLLLVYFLAMVLPYILYMYVSTKNIVIKLLLVVVILILMMVLYWTYSRTAFLLVGMIVLAMLGAMAIRFFPPRARKFAYRFMIVTALSSVVVTVANFEAVAQFFIENSSSRSEEASVLSRLSQYMITIDLIENSLLLGKGTVRNIGEAYDELSTIDNFYLRVFIESGLIGLVIFLTIIFKIIIRYTHVIIDPSQPLEKFVFISFSVQAINMLLLSMPNNHFYFYLSIYLLLCLKHLDNGRAYDVTADKYPIAKGNRL